MELFQEFCCQRPASQLPENIQAILSGMRAAQNPSAEAAPAQPQSNAFQLNSGQ